MCSRNFNPFTLFKVVNCSDLAIKSNRKYSFTQVLSTYYATPNFSTLPSLKPLNQSKLPRKSLFPSALLSLKSVNMSSASLAMATPKQNHFQTSQNNGSLEESVTVIRYQPGSERFQMQITLYNGKVCNFDRSCRDSVENVLSRMMASVCKKDKKFEGSVKFLRDGVNATEGIDSETTEIDFVLKESLASSSLQVQVGEHVYNVVFNPPEVYTVKFLGTFMPTFPLFPYRMETSENFCKEKSLYKWEFSMEKPSPPVPAKLLKKAKNDSATTKVPNKEEWVTCGNSWLFTPDMGMEGGYLKFSCIPSNGETLGKEFSITLPNPITSLPVDRFIYEERLTRLKPKGESPGCLRVLTYNVLADTYATPEWFISSPKESLDAGFRFPILNKEIQSYQADVICLQEVDEKFYQGNFEPFLNGLGYKGIHTSKTRNTKEGIATFHRPDKLAEIESHICIIGDHMKTLPLWKRLEAVGSEFIDRLDERNTVFQLSVFQVKDCPKKTILLLGNVHLFFHPDADHIRLLQTITCIHFLQSKLECIKEAYPDSRVAVIFCGDFNCTPPFSSYRLLTSGKIEEDDEDWTSHSEEKISPGISFSHSLNFTNSHPNEELTNITTCFEGCLDYILFQAEHMKLVNTYPPPSKEELAALTKTDDVRKVSLPNFYTPSDHLPLIADLKLKL